MKNNKIFSDLSQIDELKKNNIYWYNKNFEKIGGFCDSNKNLGESEDNFLKSKNSELSKKYGELVDKFCNELVDVEKSVLSTYHMASGLPQLFAQMLNRNPEKRLKLWEIKKKINELIPSVGEIAVLKRLEQLNDIFNKKILDLKGTIEKKFDEQNEIINKIKDGLLLQSNLLDGLYDNNNTYPRLILIIPDVKNIFSYAKDIEVNNVVTANGNNFINSLIDTGITPDLSITIPTFLLSINWKKFLMQEYRICCVCEFTGVVIDSGLKVGIVKDWFRKAAPFIQVKKSIFFFFFFFFFFSLTSTNIIKTSILMYYFLELSFNPNRYK